MVLGMDDIARRLSDALREETARLFPAVQRRLAELSRRRLAAARRRQQSPRAATGTNRRRDVATVTALPVAHARRRAA
jgi:hypothetical protein